MCPGAVYWSLQISLTTAPTVEIITISFLLLAILFSSSPCMYSVGELEIDEDV